MQKLEMDVYVDIKIAEKEINKNKKRIIAIVKQIKVIVDELAELISNNLKNNPDQLDVFNTFNTNEEKIILSKQITKKEISELVNNVSQISVFINTLISSEKFENLLSVVVNQVNNIQNNKGNNKLGIDTITFKQIYDIYNEYKDLNLIDNSTNKGKNFKKKIKSSC